MNQVKEHSQLAVQCIFQRLCCTESNLSSHYYCKVLTNLRDSRLTGFGEVSPAKLHIRVVFPTDASPTIKTLKKYFFSFVLLFSKEVVKYTLLLLKPCGSFLFDYFAHLVCKENSNIRK